MRIGIVEIMPIGHYTLVDSIARIYLSDPTNEIIIFSNKNATQNFTRLIAEMKSRLKIVIKEDDLSIPNFFMQVDMFPVDILYFVTLEKNLADFFHFNFRAPSRVVIHNIDDWFNIKFKILIYRFFHGLNLKNLIYKMKTCFIQSFWKTRIVKKVIKNKGKFVVLNSSLKAELSKYTNPEFIEIIPFSVFISDIVDLSKKNSKIRICIPGIIDPIRRDYFSVLKIFEEEMEIFKDCYELDLLGSLKMTKTGAIIKKQADKLINNGLQVYYYTSEYLPLDKYDECLSKSNLILGNMNVIINKYSSYGKTKESGIAYTMIRLAKPGILPSQYPVMDEIKSSVLTFSSYSDLKSLLIRIAEKRDILEELEKKAKINSLSFAPSNLLKSMN
jgi:hypothetical protein